MVDAECFWIRLLLVVGMLVAVGGFVCLLVVEGVLMRRRDELTNGSIA